jgi:hypothetical protein
VFLVTKDSTKVISGDVVLNYRSEQRHGQGSLGDVTTTTSKDATSNATAATTGHHHSPARVRASPAGGPVAVRDWRNSFKVIMG